MTAYRTVTAELDAAYRRGEDARLKKIQETGKCVVTLEPPAYDSGERGIASNTADDWSFLADEGDINAREIKEAQDDVALMLNDLKSDRIHREVYMGFSLFYPDETFLEELREALGGLYDRQCKAYGEYWIYGI